MSLSYSYLVKVKSNQEMPSHKNLTPLCAARHYWLINSSSMFPLHELQFSPQWFVLPQYYLFCWLSAIIKWISLLNIFSFQLSGTFLAACSLIFFLYAILSLTNNSYASRCAGLFSLGLSRRSWIPRSICLIVIAGRQPSSSFKMLKHIVPEGWRREKVKVTWQIA